MEEHRMKKRISLIITVMLLLSVMTAALASSAEESAAETVSVFPAGSPDEVAAVILHTNDVHAGYADNIGYDGLVLYKKELEALYDHVLLVDAGDAVQGTVIASLSNGTEIIRMMNRAGYDLAAPGNHEFDFGFDALEECSELLSCGYTCANFCTADGEPVFSPWKILEAGDLKIGFVATVTPYTFTQTSIRNIVNEVGEPMYDFLVDNTGDRLCDALQKRIDEVRANGADYVILLAHLGSDTKTPSIYSSNAVVGKLTGLDMVIDSHTHEVYNTRIPDKEGRMIPVAQAGEKLKAVGQLTIYRDGHMEETLVELVPSVSGIPSELVQRKKTDRYVDPEMKAFLDDITASYEPVLERKIGYNPADLVVWDGVRDYNRAEENGLCDLVADSQRVLAGAQAAMVHAGSVRNNLSAGEITCKDVLNTLPYYNEIVKVSVSGQMILDALEFSVSFLPKRVGGFLQVSGISFSVNPDLGSSVQTDEKKQFICVEGDRRVHDVTIAGRALDPKAEYTLAINMFLLTGGDGYTMFKEADILETMPLSDNEMLMKYIEENLGGVIPEKYGEPLGRIQWTT
jgi:2',3'-cyclic-nucleotide 2'-phosphodiesterase (5'-nucleotidase family)